MSNAAARRRRPRPGAHPPLRARLRGTATERPGNEVEAVNLVARGELSRRQALFVGAGATGFRRRQCLTGWRTCGRACDHAVPKKATFVRQCDSHQLSEAPRSLAPADWGGPQALPDGRRDRGNAGSGMQLSARTVGIRWASSKTGRSCGLCWAPLRRRRQTPEGGRRCRRRRSGRQSQTPEPG